MQRVNFAALVRPGARAPLAKGRSSAHPREPPGGGGAGAPPFPRASESDVSSETERFVEDLAIVSRALRSSERTA